MRKPFKDIQIDCTLAAPAKTLAQETAPTPNTFKHVKLTGLLYAVMGYSGYLFGGLGALLPFLMIELGLSYSLSSLHYTVLAIGNVLTSSLIGPISIGLWGRNKMFWVGGTGLALGAIALSISPGPLFTLTSTLLLGSFDALLGITIPAVLSDYYHEFSAKALTEANICGTVGGMLSPLVIGLLAHSYLGWRGAILLVVAYFLSLLLIFRHVKLPESLHPIKNPKLKQRIALSPAYWIYWLLLGLVVAVDFTVVAWCAAFLQISTGMAWADAAMAPGAFLLMLLVGRIVGSRLVNHLSSTQILFGSLSLATGGFLLYWLTPSSLAPLIIFGLLITGLGVANLYPTTFSLALAVAGVQSDGASAKASLASSGAILLAPFVLGWLADWTNLRNAHAFVIILLIGAFLTLIAASQFNRQLN